MRLGLSDGTATELLGTDVAEGTEVIVGSADAKAAAAAQRAGNAPRLPF